MSTSTTPATPKKSTWKKIEGFFSHIFSWFENDAAHFETSAATAISVAAPLVEELITLTAGTAAAAKVQAVVHQVVTDLNSTAAMLKGAEAAGGHTVSGLLGDVVKNLPALLADADVKNSAHAAQIEGVVNTVVGEVQAILAAIPAGYTTPVVGGTSAN